MSRQTATVDANQDKAWKREALRLCDRYVREVVLAFDLCPWADGALRGGRVGRDVCLLAVPTPQDCLPFIDGLVQDSPATMMDIGLLVFPRYGGSWAAFDGFAERVRRADGDRRADFPSRAPRALAVPRYLVAAFHPDGAQSFTGPHQMVSFLRRSPDPMLQFVRAGLIDDLKESQPDVSDTIARRNHAALVGAAGGASAESGEAADRPERRLDAAVRSIRADRDACYDQLEHN
ncbi:MAG: DUF1415 family protein [Deltaproteobacteria bacterium]|nr:DUF1415 family protein [Deltaproteobacteria bacterium]